MTILAIIRERVRNSGHRMPPSRKASRPGLEMLEGRTLLAGSSTVTTLMTSAAPTVTYGTSLTLTAKTTWSLLGTTKPATGGTITFFEGSRPLGAVPLSGGAATFTISTLDVGTYDLTARYSGYTSTFVPPMNSTDLSGGIKLIGGSKSAIYLPSTSAALAETITPSPLIVSARNASRVLGGPAPEISVMYDGFVNGEGPSVLRGRLEGTDRTAIDAAPGHYLDSFVPSA